MPETLNPIARERVAKGVKLLDDKVPGWWRVVNLDTLNMASCTQCMLGQLFGHNVETALGAKMFGLECDPEKAGWSDSRFIARRIGYPIGDEHYDAARIEKQRREESHGYFRGIYNLLEGEKAGSRIGCNTDGGGYSMDDLKCAWAEVIAERRASEDSDTASNSGNSAASTEGSAS